MTGALIKGKHVVVHHLCRVGGDSISETKTNTNLSVTEENI